MIQVFTDAGPFQTNSYVLDFGENKVLIDPVIDVTPALADEVTDILVTHAHFDHIVRADIWREATGAPLRAHKQAAVRMTKAEENASQTFGFPIVQEAPSHFLADGDILDYGKWKIQVIEAPGHAPDCLLFLVLEEEEPKLLITGDVIFRFDIGRCDLPGSDYKEMVNSLQRLLDLGKEWPADLPLYPGHGPSTTWGEEKARNPYMQF